MGSYCIGALIIRPLKGTLLNPTYGALKKELIESVYIPKGPPSPNFLIKGEMNPERV